MRCVLYTADRLYKTCSPIAQTAHTRFTHSSISHNQLLQIVGKVTKRGSSVKHLTEGDLVGERTVYQPAHALPEHPCPATAVCICSLRMLTAWRCAGIGWYKSCCLECNACVSGDDVSTCQADRATVVSPALRLASCMHKWHLLCSCHGVCHAMDCQSAAVSNPQQFTGLIMLQNCCPDAVPTILGPGQGGFADRFR